MAYIDTNRSAKLTAALGETHAASGIFGLFAKLKSSIEATQRHQKLRNMPPHLLRDIGFSEGDISVLRDRADIGRRDATQSLNLIR